MSIRTQANFDRSVAAERIEPTVQAAWRALDELSLAETHELEPHVRALLELRDKLEVALGVALAKEAA